MNRLGNLFHWLATPFREGRRLFPFTHEGRQTLIYLVFAGAGPALTLIGLRILDKTEGKHWGAFVEMARTFGWSLFVIVASLGLYVSIRSFKLGPSGAEFNSKDDAQRAADAVADAAVEKADEIKGDA